MSLEINKVHLMDAITGMDQMDPESVDLVVTSPPYDQLRTYNDSSGWNFETFTKIADGLIKVLKPGGVICWNVADAIVGCFGSCHWIQTLCQRCHPVKGVLVTASGS